MLSAEAFFCKNYGKSLEAMAGLAFDESASFGDVAASFLLAAP